MSEATEELTSVLRGFLRVRPQGSPHFQEWPLELWQRLASEALLQRQSSFLNALSDATLIQVANGNLNPSQISRVIRGQ